MAMYTARRATGRPEGFTMGARAVGAYYAGRRHQAAPRPRRSAPQATPLLFSCQWQCSPDPPPPPDPIVLFDLLCLSRRRRTIKFLCEVFLSIPKKQGVQGDNYDDRHCMNTKTNFFSTLPSGSLVPNSWHARGVFRVRLHTLRVSRANRTRNFWVRNRV